MSKQATVTLTDFLLARIAEDEADARQLEVDLARWDRERSANGADGSQGSIVASTLRGGAFDPARVLAKCERERRIVGWCGPRAHDAPGASASTATARFVLANLALPYADHPDYRAEWKP